MEGYLFITPLAVCRVFACTFWVRTHTHTRSPNTVGNAGLGLTRQRKLPRTERVHHNHIRLEQIQLQLSRGNGESD